MESHSDRREHDSGPSPTEAGELLDALTADASRLAARARTPNWYYPVAAVAMGVFIAGRAFAPESFWGIALLHSLPLAAVVGCFAYLAAKRPAGFWAGKALGRRSARLLGLMVATVIVGSFITVMIATQSVGPWWGLIPAAAAAATVLAIGPRYDAAFQHELARDVREGV